jgi:hypothetical protein
MSGVYAVALSVCIGVRGWGWPSLMSVCCMEMAVFALMNMAPNSTSAVEYMTAQIICDMSTMAPLLKGMLAPPAMKM